MKRNIHKQKKHFVSANFLVFISVILVAAGIYKIYYLPNLVIENLQDTPEYIENIDNSSKENNIIPQDPVSYNDIQNKIEPPKELSNAEKYNQLLEDLQKYPAKSITSVEVIVKKILQFKGYPVDIISIEVNDSFGKLQESSYVAAYFNFQKGKMHINKNALYNISIQQTIAILAHELDHFDKINQVCKSMGIRKFSEMMSENNVPDLNIGFWESASKYANLDGFKADFYQDALKRYISQTNIEVFSSYSDLYKLAEHMRNPLEVSAYEISDYILNYYNVPNVEGPMQKLIKRFNGLDWAIYDKIKDNPILTNQRIAFFDYYFAKAITRLHQDYQQAYDDCMTNKDGNLTSFWISFEKSNESFYKRGKSITPADYNTIMSTLASTETLVKNSELTNDVVYETLKIKINTLLDNIIYEDAITFIESAIEAYLKYSKVNGDASPEDELKFIITLICFSNDYYTNVQNQSISLYNMKIPSKLASVYNISSTKELVNLIAENSAFQTQYSQKKQDDLLLTQQSFLVDLIYKYRPFLKVQFKD